MAAKQTAVLAGPRPRPGRGPHSAARLSPVLRALAWPGLLAPARVKPLLGVPWPEHSGSFGHKVMFLGVFGGSLG